MNIHKTNKIQIYNSYRTFLCQHTCKIMTNYNIRIPFKQMIHRSRMDKIKLMTKKREKIYL